MMPTCSRAREVAHGRGDGEILVVFLTRHSKGVGICVGLTRSLAVESLDRVVFICFLFSRLRSSLKRTIIIDSKWMNCGKLYAILMLMLLFLLPSCDDMSTRFDNDPRGNFEALWTILDRNYCFFEYKGIDWDAVYREYSPRVSQEMGNDALFKLMGLMLAELKDGHVNLSALHDITRYWQWYEDYPANFDASICSRYLGHDQGIASGMRYKVLEDNVGYLYYGSFSNNLKEGLGPGVE